MALTDRQRVLYARHLLLAEIGEAGQERLLTSRVHVANEAPSDVCSDALRRAGLTVTHGVVGAGEASGRVVSTGSEAEIAQLAGRPELIEAARALRAAFTAVETIKEITGAGEKAAFPADLTLTSLGGDCSRADLRASTEDA